MDIRPPNIEEKSDKIITYFPVLIFILLMFLLETFQLQKATSLVISVLISLFSFGLITAYLSQKYNNQKVFKPLALKFGILSFIFFIIVIVAFMHWYKIGHVNIRWISFFLVTLVYFVLLFRSVHQLRDIRKDLEMSGKKERR